MTCIVVGLVVLLAGCGGISYEDQDDAGPDRPFLADDHESASDQDADGPCDRESLDDQDTEGLDAARSSDTDDSLDVPGVELAEEEADSGAAEDAFGGHLCLNFAGDGSQTIRFAADVGRDCRLVCGPGVAGLTTSAACTTASCGEPCHIREDWGGVNAIVEVEITADGLWELDVYCTGSPCAML